MLSETNKTSQAVQDFLDWDKEITAMSDDDAPGDERAKWEGYVADQFLAIAQRFLRMEEVLYRAAVEIATDGDVGNTTCALISEALEFDPLSPPSQ